MTEEVDLTGSAETMLATLYGRALDAAAAHPVLGDPTARAVAARIDYDYRRLGMGPQAATSVAMRAKLLDRWTREFLHRCPDATVLHLGCGLDDRVERIDPGPGVRWFDVDQPEVIALRERLYRPRAGHRALAASVTEPGWLAEVPADLPALVVAEGLTMYLPTSAGPLLLRRLVGHFPRGELAFDTCSRLGVRLSRLDPRLRRTGAHLGWGVDDPTDLEREVPGLRLLTSATARDVAEPADLARTPRAFRWQIAVLGRLPLVRRMGHVARFAFGPPARPGSGRPR